MLTFLEKYYLLFSLETYFSKSFLLERWESIGYKILGLRIRDKKSMKNQVFEALFSIFFKWIFWNFYPTIIAMIFIAIAVFFWISNILRFVYCFFFTVRGIIPSII